MMRFIVLFLYSVALLICKPVIGAEPSTRLIHRSEQHLEDTWDLQPLYSGMDEWKTALQKELLLDYDALVAKYKSAPKLTAAELRSLLDQYHEWDRNLDKLHTWAHLYHDQDVENDEGQQAVQTVTARRHSFFEAMAWIDSKIIGHDTAEIETFLAAPELAPYARSLSILLRNKPHTLSSEQESLLSLSGRATATAHAAYATMTDGDFVFPCVKDAEGRDRPLSHAAYYRYMQSSDRVLRKNAFHAYHEPFRQYENTFAELLHGEVLSHVFYAKARHYPSCLAASLDPLNIPVSVYHNLIQTVHSHVDLLHRYVHVIKQYQQLDEVHIYDLAPIAGPQTASYSYDAAVALVLEACQPLGSDYVNHLKAGLTTDRWVDRYENAHKRSGAYSGGCYDSPPYMLVNFSGTLNDVYTLIHESGHSMHSALSRSRPYHQSQYPIFVAEVASTFNESLLSYLLLQKSAGEKELQIHLIKEKIDSLRSLLFRQTLFAEFELFIHEQAEQGLPVTAKILKEKYLELYAFYYGDELVIDDVLGVEWARIPHFYYDFYVYQYATGASAAHALARRVVQGGEEAREAYLSFLKAGRSQDPIDLLRTAGVDMTTPKPIEEALAEFGRLLDRFEELVGQ